MFNPADHYVQVLAITPSSVEESRKRVSAIIQKFESSPDGETKALTIHEQKSGHTRTFFPGKAVAQEVEYQKTHEKNVSLIEKEKKKTSPYKATWFQQFRALLWRSFMSVLKEPMIMQVNLLQSIVS